MKLEEDGYEVPFGYEEAIGFMFGSEIRDKDGVAASVRHASQWPLQSLLILIIGDVRGDGGIITFARQVCKSAITRTLPTVKIIALWCEVETDDSVQIRFLPGINTLSRTNIL